MSKVLVIFAWMGAGTDPLYWGPIFSTVAASGHELRILVGHPLDSSKLPGCVVAPPTSPVRRMHPHPPNIFKLAKEIYHYGDICIVNEFSMQSSASIIISALLRRPTILLVENHPRFLEGYGIERKGLRLKIRRLVARLATVIVTNNKAGLEYIQESLYVKGPKIKVGPYLTSQLEGQSIARATGSRKIRLAAMGQLIERKGFDVLISELSSLDEEVKRDITLSIFGTGPLMQTLKAQASAAGLEDQVEFMGHVAYDRLSGLLSDFDCFVIPSRADYRSLTAFEAISLGFPLLISVHDGAISEVLDEGRNGYAFDPNVPGQLALALTKIRADLQAGEPFSERSLAKARNYTVTGAAQILESSLEHAAARR